MSDVNDDDKKLSKKATEFNFVSSTYTCLERKNW